LPVRDDDQNPLTDRGARQIVQQPQARLVGVVGIVHDEHRTPAGCGKPQQFGGANEEPLVTALSCPFRRAAAQRAFDLASVFVGQAVEQRRVAPAQVREGFEHRRVRPGTLEGGGSAHADTQPSLLRPPVEPPHHCGLADAGGPGDEERPPLPCARRDDQPVDPAQLGVAAEEHPRRTTLRLGSVGCEQLGAQ
jgi:hypothetical protein